MSEVMKDSLRGLLETAGIPASEVQLNSMQVYYELLVERNRVMNLTTITEPEEAALLHFADSLLLLNHLPLSEEGLRLADIGTGAGFPGIPLKIMRPQLQVVLVDSQRKRLSFLEEVIDTLSLRREGSIETAHGRVEDLAAKKGPLREAFDVVTARAVAALPVLSEYCLPFVKQGGIFAAYKTGTADTEAAEATNAIKTLGGSLRKVAWDVLPGSDIARSFILIDKTGPTPSRYPRQAGTPSKKPLL